MSSCRNPTPVDIEMLMVGENLGIYDVRVVWRWIKKAVY